MTAMTQPRARDGLPSQDSPSRPATRMARLTAPVCSSSRNFHSTPTTTRLITYGMKSTVRYTPMPGSLCLTSRPSARLTQNSTGTRITTYRPVIFMESQKSGSFIIRS